HLIAFPALAAALCLAPADRAPTLGAREPGEARGGAFPSDWFERQRAYPFETIDQRAYVAAVEQARFERAALAREAAAPGAGAAGAAALAWQQAGPYNTGGRITALAVTPGAATIYIGSANGGVFKSTNAGVNFTPVFDAVGVVSIGALALDRGNPAALYVGTGEANSSGDSYDGAGLFRSTDGGVSWTGLGLEQTRRIARVAVDPLNTSRIFVAAMGTQFTT